MTLTTRPKNSFTLIDEENLIDNFCLEDERSEIAAHGKEKAWQYYNHTSFWKKVIHKLKKVQELTLWLSQHIFVDSDRDIVKTIDIEEFLITLTCADNESDRTFWSGCCRTRRRLGLKVVLASEIGGVLNMLKEPKELSRHCESSSTSSTKNIPISLMLNILSGCGGFSNQFKNYFWGGNDNNNDSY